MDLADPKTLKAFLAGHGIRAEKGLGQHFLCSRSAVDSIVGRVQGVRGVLEIGPGPGVLTGPISDHVERVIALEIDARMIELLAESAPRAEVRRLDALKADLGAVMRDLPEPRAVVSNLPYYITGPLLTRVSEVRELFQVAVLMMQREVAERVLAPSGDSNRGSLSVFLQSQFEIERVCRAPAGAFLPPPKVDSTVLQFEPRPDTYSPGFFRLIRIGFAQPRKTLENNLVAGYRVERSVASEWIGRLGHKDKVRPSELGLSDWSRLAVLVGAYTLRTDVSTTEIL